ncbi:hypothetical protein [Planomicrobium sp. CPCC 101079]|nr:hypothetical protein [Planomicrobium sp. CPCC 101079]
MPVNWNRKVFIRRFQQLTLLQISLYPNGIKRYIDTARFLN